jgi:hypothetical protein
MPCSTTGPSVGSSSVACLTPGGVSVSTAFGTRPGLKLQIGAAPPGAQTPNLELLRRRLEAARLVVREAVLAGEHDREAPSWS